MIEFEQVSYTYKKDIVIHELDLHLAGNEIHAIIGPNGCGKSTVLKLASRLLKPQQGKVQLGGKDIWRMSRRECAQFIGHLRQSSSYQAQTVLDVVVSGRYPYREGLFTYTKRDYDIARQCMEQTGISKLAQVQVHQLSGGERQRVFLAALLAQQTDILLLDEPTTFLDIDATLDLMELLEQLKSAGKTILLVTHALDLALQHAGNLVLMDAGRVMAHGAPDEIIVSGQLKEMFGVDVCIWEKDGERCYTICRSRAVG